MALAIYSFYSGEDNEEQTTSKAKKNNEVDSACADDSGSSPQLKGDISPLTPGGGNTPVHPAAQISPLTPRPPNTPPVPKVEQSTNSPPPTTAEDRGRSSPRTPPLPPPQPPPQPPTILQESEVVMQENELTFQEEEVVADRHTSSMSPVSDTELADVSPPQQSPATPSDSGLPSPPQMAMQPCLPPLPPQPPPPSDQEQQLEEFQEPPLPPLPSTLPPPPLPPPAGEEHPPPPPPPPARPPPSPLTSPIGSSSDDMEVGETEVAATASKDLRRPTSSGKSLSGPSDISDTDLPAGSQSSSEENNSNPGDEADLEELERARAALQEKLAKASLEESSEGEIRSEEDDDNDQYVKKFSETLQQGSSEAARYKPSTSDDLSPVSDSLSPETAMTKTSPEEQKAATSSDEDDRRGSEEDMSNKKKKRKDSDDDNDDDGKGKGSGRGGGTSEGAPPHPPQGQESPRTDEGGNYEGNSKSSASDHRSAREGSSSKQSDKYRKDSHREDSSSSSSSSSNRHRRGHRHGDKRSSTHHSSKCHRTERRSSSQKDQLEESKELKREKETSAEAPTAKKRTEKEKEKQRFEKDKQKLQKIEQVIRKKSNIKSDSFKDFDMFAPKPPKPKQPLSVSSSRQLSSGSSSSSPSPLSFGSKTPPAFGSKTPPAFGSKTPPAFGTKTPPAFGTKTPPAFGTKTPSASSMKTPPATIKKIPAESKPAAEGNCSKSARDPPDETKPSSSVARRPSQEAATSPTFTSQQQQRERKKSGFNKMDSFIVYDREKVERKVFPELPISKTDGDKLKQHKDEMEHTKKKLREMREKMQEEKKRAEREKKELKRLNSGSGTDGSRAPKRRKKEKSSAPVTSPTVLLTPPSSTTKPRCEPEQRISHRKKLTLQDLSDEEEVSDWSDTESPPSLKKRRKKSEGCREVGEESLTGNEVKIQTRTTKLRAEADAILKSDESTLELNGFEQEDVDATLKRKERLASLIGEDHDQVEVTDDDLELLLAYPQYQDFIYLEGLSDPAATAQILEEKFGGHPVLVPPLPDWLRERLNDWHLHRHEVNLIFERQETTTARSRTKRPILEKTFDERYKKLMGRQQRQQAGKNPRKSMTPPIKAEVPQEKSKEEDKATRVPSAAEMIAAMQEVHHESPTKAESSGKSSPPPKEAESDGDETFVGFTPEDVTAAVQAKKDLITDFSTCCEGGRTFGLESFCPPEENEEKESSLLSVNIDLGLLKHLQQLVVAHESLKGAGNAASQHYEGEQTNNRSSDREQLFNLFSNATIARYYNLNLFLLGSDSPDSFGSSKENVDVDMPVERKSRRISSNKATGSNRIEEI